MKKGFARFLSGMLGAACLFQLTGGIGTCAEESVPAVPNVSSAAGEVGEVPDYTDYIALHQDASAPDESILIKAAMYSQGTGSLSVRDETLLTGADSYVTWKFVVPQTGLYNLTFRYYPTISKGGAIERTLYLDGKIPYQQAAYLRFSRIYTDAEEGIVEDGNGNDLRPEQVESPRWITWMMRDSNEYIRENLKLYLTAGEHTLSLEAVKEELQLDTIEFSQAEEPEAYDAYQKEISGQASGGETLQWVEAEEPQEKSNFTIYPLFDKKSPATYPQDPIKVRLNTIGGGKWAAAGQWISWQVDIQESGYYQIAPRYRQDTYAGGYVSRRLEIDGKCPFEEAEAIRFNYTDKWRIDPLGDGEQPFVFYLEKGIHTVTMSVVMGDMAEVLRRVNNTLTGLNADYRRILMLTGTSPDIYRDYDFENLIPDVLEDLQARSEELQEVVRLLEQETGIKGDYTVQLNKLVILLDKIKEDPENISGLFTTFKDSLASLGTWVQSAAQQPLELDRLYFVPQGEEMPKADGSFWDSLVFQVKAFFLSFFEDYQSFSSSITPEDVAENRVIKVWMASGRDQCQALQQLADQYFTAETGMKVNLQLVVENALLPAVLAGIGPDVALSTPTTDPINFAIRGAVTDLQQFNDVEEIVTRFHESALESFRFNGALYALPETESFPVMFYRTDIFAELGLAVPKTWDDFYALIPVLQKQNMTVGFPVNSKPSVISNANLLGLKIFLYQNGGSLYNEDLTASNMAEDINVAAFQQVAELFTLYKFPVDYDFANRFRSGEMPLGIADYTQYNQLTLFAPEIKGLWEMAPLPGVLQEDGTINNASPSGGLGAMMLADAKDKDNSWEFLKWWTREDTQSRYAIEIESILGPAAKLATANVNALASMSWTAKEYAVLSAQMENLVGTPEIPGGYYTARAVDFAFSSVYTDKEKAVAALLDNVTAINEEITRKRHEFGLD